MPVHISECEDMKRRKAPRRAGPPLPTPQRAAAQQAQRGSELAAARGRLRERATHGAAGLAAAAEQLSRV
jgi:hypothetical protein